MVKEIQNDDGSRTVVASIEIWNTMLTVQSTIVSPDPIRHQDPRRSSRMWACADDIGTAYSLLGGGGGGGERYWVERMEFTPAPPADAKRLTLSPPHAPGTSIDVEL